MVLVRNLAYIFVYTKQLLRATRYKGLHGSTRVKKEVVRDLNVGMHVDIIQQNLLLLLRDAPLSGGI